MLTLGVSIDGVFTHFSLIYQEENLQRLSETSKSSSKACEALGRISQKAD
ncbi:hypothetical protein M23134_07267 [Microscilla marina ATCC 23134]|uniref:Uncharacterized protein n=1 Tax=Microscilla marina ATCC 23134 TaxID=313606 RepID=A1ZVB8_MICM2|nr:hypothetical protein M23134_07267 [Microscilla marina ATCC 23134]